MDKLTAEQRRNNMQADRASGSKIETALAKALFEVPFGDITKEETKKLISGGFDVVGLRLSGRAFHSNLFVRNEQKGFPLQYLTKKAA